MLQIYRFGHNVCDRWLIGVSALRVDVAKRCIIMSVTVDRCVSIVSGCYTQTCSVMMPVTVGDRYVSVVGGCCT